VQKQDAGQFGRILPIFSRVPEHAHRTSLQPLPICVCHLVAVLADLWYHLAQDGVRRGPTAPPLAGTRQPSVNTTSGRSVGTLGSPQTTHSHRSPNPTRLYSSMQAGRRPPLASFPTFDLWRRLLPLASCRAIDLRRRRPHIGCALSLIVTTALLLLLLPCSVLTVTAALLCLLPPALPLPPAPRPGAGTPTNISTTFDAVPDKNDVLVSPCLPTSRHP
jgi:hypothetical protein